MKRIGPNVYSAKTGETLSVKVESRTFANIAQLDPKLNPAGAAGATQTGTLTMAGADAFFNIIYSFPGTLTAADQYTVTFSGPGMPDDSFPVPGNAGDNLPVGYTLRFEAAVVGAQ